MLKVSKILTANSTYEWTESTFEYDGDRISGYALLLCRETGTVFYVNKDNEMEDSKNPAREVSEEEIEAANAWIDLNGSFPEEWVDEAYQEFEDGEAAERDAWSDSKRYFGY